MTARVPVLVLAVLGVALTACDVPLISKPAAKWDGGQVSNSDFQDRVKQQTFLDQKTRQIQGLTPTPSTDKSASLRREDKVIQDLVDESLMRDEDGRRHIDVSDSDVTKIYNDTRTAYDKQAVAQNQAGNPQPNFEDYLKSFGYTTDTFRAELKSRLYEQKLESSMALKRAQDTLAALNKGTDFASVAKQWSDDSGTAATGGQAKFTAADLQQMDQSVKPALDALQPNQTSSAPVRGALGYFVFRVLTRDAAGVSFDIVQVTAPDFQHYRKTERPTWFQDFVTQLEKKAHVQYFVGSRVLTRCAAS